MIPCPMPTGTGDNSFATAASHCRLKSAARDNPGAKMSCILGIETTCDETACAVVESGRIVKSNVVRTQIDLHQKYGGVVPVAEAVQMRRIPLAEFFRAASGSLHINGHEHDSPRPTVYPRHKPTLWPPKRRSGGIPRVPDNAPRLFP